MAGHTRIIVNIFQKYSNHWIWNLCFDRFNVKEIQQSFCRTVLCHGVRTKLEDRIYWPWFETIINTFKIIHTWTIFAEFPCMYWFDAILLNEDIISWLKINHMPCFIVKSVSYHSWYTVEDFKWINTMLVLLTQNWKRQINIMKYIQLIICTLISMFIPSKF